MLSVRSTRIPHRNKDRMRTHGIRCAVSSLSADERLTIQSLASTPHKKASSSVFKAFLLNSLYFKEKRVLDTKSTW